MPRHSGLVRKDQTRNLEGANSPFLTRAVERLTKRQAVVLSNTPPEDFSLRATSAYSARI
jgi:hypothetical protein